jgi:hypothetical protein
MLGAAAVATYLGYAGCDGSLFGEAALDAMQKFAPPLLGKNR